MLSQYIPRERGKGKNAGRRGGGGATWERQGWMDRSAKRRRSWSSPAIELKNGQSQERATQAERWNRTGRV